MSERPYTYRIVLEQLNGERLPLVPQDDRFAAVQRLREILNDPNTTYLRGWVERRTERWEISHIETPSGRRVL